MFYQKAILISLNENLLLYPISGQQIEVVHNVLKGAKRRLIASLVLEHNLTFNAAADLVVDQFRTRVATGLDVRTNDDGTIDLMCSEFNSYGLKDKVKLCYIKSRRLYHPTDGTRIQNRVSIKAPDLYVGYERVVRGLPELESTIDFNKPKKRYNAKKFEANVEAMREKIRISKENQEKYGMTLPSLSDLHRYMYARESEYFRSVDPAYYRILDPTLKNRYFASFIWNMVTYIFGITKIEPKNTRYLLKNHIEEVTGKWVPVSDERIAWLMEEATDYIELYLNNTKSHGRNKGSKLECEIRRSKKYYYKQKQKRLEQQAINQVNRIGT